MFVESLNNVTHKISLVETSEVTETYVNILLPAVYKDVCHMN